MIHIEIPEDVRTILNVIRSAGFEAYAVGGCVRDCLLGKEPKDWDITTSALPEKIKELFPRTVDTGIKHGTVTVLLKKTGYEVTTYRVDGKYLDGRHPENVSFTPNLDEDLKRRDFTINAFAYSEETGVRDLFGGLKDLENGVIRCVGVPEERFGEDALRILRAIRFSAVLGFDIEKETYAAAVKLGGLLVKVSSERIKAELDKTLMSKNPGHICLIKEMKLDRVIFPEFGDMENTGAGIGLKTVASVLEKCGCELAGRWALLCCLLGQNTGKKKEIAASVMKRLKFDNKTKAKVMLFTGLSDEGLPDPEKTGFRADLRRVIKKTGKENIRDYMAFCKAWALADDTFKNDYEALEREISDIFEKNECIRLKDLKINGFDLKAQGCESGAVIGQILNRLLDDVIEEPGLNTKDKLLEKVHEYGQL